DGDEASSTDQGSTAETFHEEASSTRTFALQEEGHSVDEAVTVDHFLSDETDHYASLRHSARTDTTADSTVYHVEDDTTTDDATLHVEGFGAVVHFRATHATTADSVSHEESSGAYDTSTVLDEHKQHTLTAQEDGTEQDGVVTDGTLSVAETELDDAQAHSN